MLISSVLTHCLNMLQYADISCGWPTNNNLKLYLSLTLEDWETHTMVQYYIPEDLNHQ